MKVVPLPQLEGWQACQFEPGDTSREFGRTMERGWYVARQPDGKLFSSEHGVVTASSRRNLAKEIWQVFKRRQEQIDDRAAFVAAYEQRKLGFDLQLAGGVTEAMLRDQLLTFREYRKNLRNALASTDLVCAEHEALLLYLTEGQIEVTRGNRSMVFSVNRIGDSAEDRARHVLAELADACRLAFTKRWNEILGTHEL